MASLFSRLVDLFGPGTEDPIHVSAPPTRETSSTPSPQLAQSNDDALSPLKNWSHPFKDKSNPLMQLTQMAKAAAGYYPLGCNGLWHGGVHFDSGTAGTLDQSSVHCLSDGEVVAYRIDEFSPTTTYFTEELCLPKPFSRNFVLVRHRLEAPKIEGSPDVPPSLIFYSLYMHLQDWAAYRNAPSIARPSFWPEGQTRRVKTTVRDVRTGPPEQWGLNVRNQAQGGKVLALLPRGAEVTVSGEGEYRKLEKTNGPDVLKNADGSLLGFLSIDYLVPIAGVEYRVKANPSLRVRAEASTTSAVLMELPEGTEVTVSGEGRFRKLERVNQYVHFNSLEGALEPIPDQIVVLDQPIAIRAGELIGHIGEYQDGNAKHPEKKLHLEVFSADRVELFIETSRAWTQRLPAASKTWLKFPKGTAVVTHQEHFNAIHPPTLRTPSTPSDADLLVPKSLIDGLPTNKKIVVTATPDRRACNWYRLDRLFHDADGALLDGWVCEEASVTPWVSPWSWEGYEVVFNYDSPRQTLASFFRAAGRFNEEQLKRHGPSADMSDKASMKSHLYDVIDRNRDGKMTAEELQTAIALPAHAQSLSQLIMLYESEWRHLSCKWDELDEVLGHSGSTPLLNWVAEKGRIKEISWWNEVALKVGLPEDGRVYHFHPVGLIGQFLGQDQCACGRYLGAVFSTTRYGKQYGPVYWGKIKLEDFQGWNELINKGMLTTTERDILIAMSENEGNMDAVQSYDSEILTAGAMQKTINPQGAGELPLQIYEFRREHPALYKSLFSDCGWKVKTEEAKNHLYYNGVTGNDLKVLIRKGFDQAAFESKKPLSSKPLATFVNAITNDQYLAKQTLDFARRLRTAVALSPSGYNAYTIGEYIHSNLGKAVILDHHVNRPGFVARDFGMALRVFLTKNPTIDESPKKWGSNHSRYEFLLLEIYGPSRDMTNANLRYQHLKKKL